MADPRCGDEVWVRLRAVRLTAYSEAALSRMAGVTCHSICGARCQDAKMVVGVGLNMVCGAWVLLAC